jgi:hypothetical protein
MQRLENEGVFSVGSFIVTFLADSPLANAKKRRCGRIRRDQTVVSYLAKFIPTAEISGFFRLFVYFYGEQRFSDRITGSSG